MGTATAKRHEDHATFRYISMVNAIPALEREQELRLARAYLEHGDAAAKQSVIQANLRHVVPVALRYRHFGVSLAELIAQGNLALTLALDRFEPERGLRLATYANHWVRAEILSLVLTQRSMVGGGRGPLRAKFVFRMRREHAQLLAKCGDDLAARTQLSERYRKSPEELADILARIESRDSSLDLQVGGGKGSALSELLPGELTPSDEQVDLQRGRATVTEAVRAAMADLTERERFIVERRLMADDESRMSLVEIGRRFGVSRERARQIETRLKQKLRNRLAAVADSEVSAAAA